MGQFNEEMIRAGVLVAAEGLDPDAASGVVVDYSSETPVATDGPYGEAKELFGGFWIRDVADLGEGGVLAGSALADPVRDAEDVLWNPDQIEDDVLALMFIAGHPVLSRKARVALTLRGVGGLSSDEIARAFLVPTATVEARINRAKKTLAAARMPFEVPPAEERTARVGSVLSVVYLVFTEGSSATPI